MQFYVDILLYEFNFHTHKVVNYMMRIFLINRSQELFLARDNLDRLRISKSKHCRINFFVFLDIHINVFFLINMFRHIYYACALQQTSIYK